MSSTLTSGGPAAIARLDDTGPLPVRGTTRIADVVVAKLAQRAAMSVDEVVGLDRGAAGAVSGVVGRVRGGDHAIGGVSVEVGTTQAAVDLTAAVRYPAAIARVADAIRDAVRAEVTGSTALEVIEVNVAVIDLPLESDERRVPRRRVS
jgi:uncharacterized alkaline shock family protein YloU